MRSILIRETMAIILGILVVMVGTSKNGRMVVATNTVLTTMVLACKHRRVWMPTCCSRQCRQLSQQLRQQLRSPSQLHVHLRR
jgi:hypothetical protein